MSGLSDDEAMFVEISRTLGDQIEAALCPWTVRSVESRIRGAAMVFGDEERRAAQEAGNQCRVEVGPVIRGLLSTDIDEQRTTPLVIIRQAVSYPTAVLAKFGVPEVGRDGFERRAFPLDIYHLAPASLGDVEESLAQQAMLWGAAKAHIHRQRHQRAVE